VKPTILIVTSDRWLPTARIAMALAQAGCTVDAVAPSSHPMLKTGAVRRTYPYRGLSPLSSVRNAIQACQPDLLVPADDRATWHLHELWNSKNGSAEPSTRNLIARSLGSPKQFPVVQSRTLFMELAQKKGVRVPPTAVLRNQGDLSTWIGQHGLPVVLKANGTSGGEGVRVARAAEEAKSAFRRLHAPPLVARALKRAIVDFDSTLLKASFLRQTFVVNAQEFIAGCEANTTVACWKGEVIASLHFKVLQKRHASGPATVLRHIQHEEMDAAVATMVRELNLSGFHGFDFMLEQATGNAYLIEINPRTTQVGHLSFGPGHDLPAAIADVITGSSAVTSSKQIENDTVALFPHEWARDPASPYLAAAHHDIPWEAPRLVNAVIANLKAHRADQVAAFRADLAREMAKAPQHVIRENAATLPGNASQAASGHSN
jgi:carbamoylphosphate synthase large subunit